MDKFFTPFNGHLIRGYLIWDPPHGDYYSRPSQPSKFRSMVDLIIDTIEIEAAPYYFWLGRDAETL